MKATHDVKTFTLTGPQWSGTYPIEDLTKWLDFYRGARERFPKSGTAYDATIQALEEPRSPLSHCRLTVSENSPEVNLSFAFHVDYRQYLNQQSRDKWPQIGGGPL